MKFATLDRATQIDGASILLRGTWSKRRAGHSAAWTSVIVAHVQPL